MSAPDPARLALERALTLAREQVATLEAALAGEPELTGPDSYKLGEAARLMKVEANALRKRAFRDKGAIRGKAFIKDGVWHLMADYVEARRRLR